MNNSLEKVNTSIVLKKTKRFKDEKDRYPVKLQLSYRRKQKFYSIAGERCTPEEFEAIINPKSKNDKKVRREKYNAIQRRADKVIKELEIFTFEDFEKEYLGEKGRAATIQEYFENKAKELDAANKLSSAILYRATLKSLEQFDKNISFSKISPKYLKAYENWMVSDDEGKTYTTVGVYMRNLKHIINRAIKNRVTISYPFGSDKDKYQIPVSNNTKKALNLEDIQKLVTYQSDIPQEMQAQKYWIFSYLCSGMNMVDIANLRYKNIQGNSLKFIRQKTKDTTKVKTEIDVFLTPEAIEIIDQIGCKNNKPEDYIFPILEKGMSEQEKYNRVKQHIKNTNKYMKKIAEKLEIDVKITTYYARHSYSTVLKRSGVSIDFIREQLGHQTTKVTQNYLDSFEDEQREKFTASLLDFSKN
ncbi:tyrosine-type recombinase/integrase [Marinifilum flexuosum]|uniref:tyrosine-type recombinase/integrase n=1 Tax=Marinifilum flexuosum TaxID=1117708 RepID=UPI00248FAD75|nr:site-specific integrase [Marinifilum flexuosum]